MQIQQYKWEERLLLRSPPSCKSIQVWPAFFSSQPECVLAFELVQNHLTEAPHSVLATPPPCNLGYITPKVFISVHPMWRWVVRHVAKLLPNVKLWFDFPISCTHVQSTFFQCLVQQQKTIWFMLQSGWLKVPQAVVAIVQVDSSLHSSLLLHRT